MGRSPLSAVLALPAAVRLPRTVAARRALLAGLFLVGFVALGFAFGPGAHADDRTRTADLSGVSTPAGPAAEASTPDRAATRDGAANRLSGSGAAFERQGKASGAKLAERTHSASGAVAEAVRPAAEQVAPATGRITEPVSRVVREVGESAGAELPVHLPSGEHAERPGDGTTHPHGRTPGEAQQAGQGTAATVVGAAAAQASHCAADMQEAGRRAPPGRRPRAAGPGSPRPSGPVPAGSDGAQLAHRRR